ncbi:unnamed protein product [Lactuca virosa]|uniref:GOLD domain-containing protein n=1 Tax=Lactuca virosa TaxID=75947 RepID=A0AAU9PI15_9ASTR|nr:unnamed protein product [Lactuca virosa]
MERGERTMKCMRFWGFFSFCFCRRCIGSFSHRQRRRIVYEYVLYEGDTVSGNFVVVDHDIFWSSDHPGIDFIVSSPGGNVVQTMKGTSGEKFEFKAPRSGMYQFCFHNPYSTPETVSFYIHVGHIPNEHDLAKDEHLDPVNVKIAELREALESVTAEQKYLKARDARHRHTNESTHKRVIFLHNWRIHFVGTCKWTPSGLHTSPV